MNNSGIVTAGQHSITIEAKVVISPYLKVILVLFFILAALFTISVMSMVAGDSAKSKLGLTLLGSALLFFSGRYALWNIAGSEIIIITTQSICYSRKYGTIGRPARVILFQYLATHIETIKQEKDRNWAIMNFYDRNAKTMLLQHIFSSAVYLPVDQLETVQEQIRELFERQHSDHWLSFSQN